ncbi:MAG: NAD(P)H-hydrate dehydratase [Candidatus Nitrospinota bacterium M3_3B_026]
MIKAFTAAQTREMDRKAIEDLKIPSLVLMENAGRAVVRAIRKKIPGLKKVRVNIFAGKGNNGGDGFVVGRHLLNMGAEPTVFLVAEKPEIKGDAKVNMDAYVNSGGRLKEFTSRKHIQNFKLKFFHTTVVVDALLGTGIKSAPRGFYNEALDVMNSQGRLKVAVDIPSGLSADSGVIAGNHFNADVTVTLGAPKVGLFTFPARQSVGELIVADISIPRAVIDEAPCAAYVPEREDIAERLPARTGGAHKGLFGHLVIASGSEGMGGAVALAGEGALRSGAGLVTAAIPEGIAAGFEVGVREMMTLPLPGTQEGTIAADAAGAFLKFAKDKTAALIGPGLRTNPSTREFVKRAVAELSIPLVLDADGLNNIGEDFEVIKNRKAPTIVTPHPGEMRRLTGMSVADIQADRTGAAAEYAEKTGAVVVLKGAGTVIAVPGGGVYINPTGNTGLASGGTGDVLSGVIGGFLAQGAAPEDATVMGVYIHGLLADVYAETKDPAALIAGDLPELLPVVLKKLRGV